MAPKLLWIALPLLLYAVWLAAMRWRGRTPPRLALNVHTSVLLLCYLLGTAGLGVFWVANQQLPVFDWHYLFGYATLLLAFIHLCFNFPLVLNWLRRRTPARQDAAAATPRGALAFGVPLAMLAALAVAFFLGTRQGAGSAQFHRDAQGAAASAATVLRYHELSSESRASVFLRAPGIEWGDAPAPFKTYPQAPQIALPAGRPASQPLQAALRGPASAPQRRLRLDELAQVLFLAAGVTERRGGRALRAAPSSGALFPSELYVAARAIDGLAPGLYHYDPDRHRLARLAPLPAAPDALGAPEARDADALLILSAIFRRTGYKYHNRAYRYAVADAGHLLENLRIAGHQAGMQAALLTRFDEALAARALAIDGMEEGVLAMMTLQRPVQEAGMQPAAAPVYTEAPLHTVAAFGATSVIQQATSLRLAPTPAALQAGAGTGASAPLPPRALRLPPVTAPAVPSASAAVSPAAAPPARAPGDVHAVIEQRRSVRRYASQPVPLVALSAILAGMAQPPQLSDAMRIDLVINRVAGVKPGIYRYLPQHALLPLAEGDFATRAQQAALAQDVIGDAAVVLLLSADSGRVLAQGPRGYRHALLEAGLLGERWLLGAVAHGLAACPVGAFYDDEAAALIGPHGPPSSGARPAAPFWVLHFAALGVR